MKKRNYMLLFIFFQLAAQAQISDKLSIELNIGRYANESGLFEYDHEFSFLNGFNLEYNKSERWQYYLGLRNMNTRVDSPPNLTHESSNVNGVEIKTGLKFSPNPHKRFFLSYGIELFNELSNVEGLYSTDVFSPAIINHRKNFFGMAPILTLNLKLTDNILLFANTRYQWGYLNLEKRETNNRIDWHHRDLGYYLGRFEALNALGLRFDI